MATTGLLGTNLIRDATTKILSVGTLAAGQYLRVNAGDTEVESVAGSTISSIYDAIVPDDYATPGALIAALPGTFPTGGSFLIRSGTYTEAAALSVTDDNYRFFGQNKGDTIIDFDGTGSLSFDSGVTPYRTGTITYTAGSTAVVGVGTLFTTIAAAGPLVVERSLFIPDYGYIQIASITDDTNLVLLEVIPPNLSATGTSDWYVTEVLSGIHVENIMFINEDTGPTVSFVGCDRPIVRNICMIETSGLYFTDCWTPELVSFDIDHKDLLAAGKDGIVLNKTVDMIIDRGVITQCFNGISTAGTETTIANIANVSIKNNHNDGINCETAGLYSTMSDCVIENNTRDGIRLGFSRVILTGVISDFNLGYGLFGAAGNAVSYMGNSRFQRNESGGIDANVAFIEGSEIKSNLGHGIRIQSGDTGSRISGNRIINNDDRGIEVEETRVSIIGNYIGENNQNTQVAEVNIAVGADKCIITGNTIAVSVAGTDGVVIAANQCVASANVLPTTDATQNAYVISGDNNVVSSSNAFEYTTAVSNTGTGNVITDVL